MLILSLLLPGEVFARIEAKTIDHATGQFVQPTPSFRNVFGRGESNEPTKQGSSPRRSSSAAARMVGGTSPEGIPLSTTEVSYQVHVLGEVQMPGTYRVSASERLSELLESAGDITPAGSERWIELRREGQPTRTVDLFLFRKLGRLDENPYLSDNDVVYVPLTDKIIQIVGAVKRPDYYELKNERTLADAIQLAGGFHNGVAHSQPVRVIRFEAGQKKIYEVVQEESPMKDFSVEKGDVIVVPDVMTMNTEFDYNPASIPGGQLFYPSYEDYVFVLGAVDKPQAYEYSPHYKLGQYISLSGGFTDLAKQGKIWIIKYDGKKQRAKLDDRVNPGDTIFVTRRTLRPIEWTTFIMSITSFALSMSVTILAYTR